MLKAISVIKQSINLMIFKKTGESEYLFPFKAFKDPF
jgi:hypothetical protein